LVWGTLRLASSPVLRNDEQQASDRHAADNFFEDRSVWDMSSCVMEFQIQRIRSLEEGDTEKP